MKPSSLMSWLIADNYAATPVFKDSIFVRRGRNSSESLTCGNVPYSQIWSTLLSFSWRSWTFVCCSALVWKTSTIRGFNPNIHRPLSYSVITLSTIPALTWTLCPLLLIFLVLWPERRNIAMSDFRIWYLKKRLFRAAQFQFDLLYPVLVVCSLPLQVLAGLPRLLQLSLVQVATAASSRQILLQLPDGYPHLLQLCVVLLRARIVK